MSYDYEAETEREEKVDVKLWKRMFGYAMRNRGLCLSSLRGSEGSRILFSLVSGRPGRLHTHPAPSRPETVSAVSGGHR